MAYLQPKLILAVYLILMLNIGFITGKDKTIEIGIIVDGSWQQNSEYIELIIKEINELTESEFTVLFPEDKIIVCDWSANKVKSAVDELLSDQDVDFILTLGVIASHEIATRTNLEKPVIAPFILDPEIQKIPQKEGKSGVKNLNYIHIPFTSRNTLSDFLNVVEFKNMAFLFNKVYLDVIPGLEGQIRSLTQSMGINFYPFPVGQSIKEVFTNFPEEIDAVYVSPLIHLPGEEYKILISELINRKMPSFSLLGTTDVELGILTTNRPDIFPRVARRIALNIQRILLGEKPHEIPVYFSPGEQITINMETARSINIFPRVAVLTEAELINEEESGSGQSLQLEEAILEAVKSNLDIMAKKSFVSAGSENIPISRSELLPQINISALGLLIDKDRAESSFGTQPEQTITGTLEATQLIYSEPVWANFSIQKSIQQTRLSEFEQLEYDIILASASAFLNVLRAKIFERIQKENLRRTKSNLEMAIVRESIGTAGPAEVYRWQSELANNRNSVIRVLAEKNIARIQLNRILNRKLNSHYEIMEQNIYYEELQKNDNLFTRYLNNPRYFELIQEFFTQVGMENSPELQALDHAIRAKERARSSANNNFWAPTIALKAEYSSILKKSGAGSDISGQIPGLSIPNNEFWNIGLNLSFPLFNSGKKFALRRQAYDELEQLQLERQSVAQIIEQQIRSSLYNVIASYASITQTGLASEAAQKSLKVVKDGYAQGMVSILDLLDAQNTTLVSEELESNAVFDFIIDLLLLERASGVFYINLKPEEAGNYLKRFEEYTSGGQ